MTPYEWPASLPCFRWEPYSLAIRPGAMELDFGMLTPKARIYTETNEVANVVVVLTSAQEQALRTFFKTTLGMGTATFTVPIWTKSALETREVMFLGAPPVYTPVALDVVSASFQLLVYPGVSEQNWELIASEAVNISANELADSPTQPATPGGTVVTVTCLATDRIVITKPSIIADPGLTWNAHSRYPQDDSNPPGTGLTWFNPYLVSDDAGALITSSPSGANTAYATADLSQAAVEGLFPQILTGHTQYKFWYWDTPIIDNRGGISLRVETYRLA